MKYITYSLIIQVIVTVILLFVVNSQQTTIKYKNNQIKTLTDLYNLNNEIYSSFQKDLALNGLISIGVFNIENSTSTILMIKDRCSLEQIDMYKMLFNYPKKSSSIMFGDGTKTTTEGSKDYQLKCK